MKSASSDCLVAFKIPKQQFETLKKLSREQDLTRSQILRKSLREFLSLYELEKESPGSVIDPPADWQQR